MKMKSSFGYRQWKRKKNGTLFALYWGKTREKVRKKHPPWNNETVREAMRLVIRKTTRTKWKWRHCGHFVVSLVPDILSGEARSLHAPVCHSGHTSSRLGRRGRVILNPINNHYIYLWGRGWLGMYCYPHFLTYNESRGQMILVSGFLGGKEASLPCRHSDNMNYWEGVRKRSNFDVICGLVIGSHLL